LTEDFRKCFTPQEELLDNQAFWLRISDPTSKPSNALPIKIEAPKELLKISLVNESLKKLKYHLSKFDNVVKIKTTPNACTEVVLLTVMNSMSLLGESVNVDEKRKESCNNEEELLESQNAFNSLLKRTRVRTLEQSDSLIDKLNLKSTKNEDLKAQIQDKVLVITSLKNDLRIIKGKEIINIAAQKSSANTIVPGMFKLDLEPLAPWLLQNREIHLEYLKNTQEQDDILQGIVKQAKAK
nr:hypothetical protein [Tanacetum cinerariifolium]